MRKPGGRASRVQPKQQTPLCAKPRSRPLEESAARDRDGKHPPSIDLHRTFLETRHPNQLVDLRGSASPHDPSLSLAIAQDASDEFKLRMPGLIGVNQPAARLNCPGQST